jgi:hypothetical protein
VQLKVPSEGVDIASKNDSGFINNGLNSEDDAMLKIFDDLASHTGTKLDFC